MTICDFFCKLLRRPRNCNTRFHFVVDRILRTSPCICGSGLRFKACCGAQDPPHWNSRAVGKMQGSLWDAAFTQLVANQPICKLDDLSLPPGIMAVRIEDRLPWKQIVNGLLRDAVDSPATVTLADGTRSRDRQRETGILQLENDHQRLLAELTRRAYKEFVEPFFNRHIRWYEKPQILRYRPGGYYAPHSDADFYNKGSGNWQKVLDRDLSMLLYLDDGYQGGELIFPNFNFRLRPEAGLLVAFPSDHRYLHGAMPLVKGIRHVLVGWSSIAGQERVSAEVPDGAIMTDVGP